MSLPPIIYGWAIPQIGYLAIFAGALAISLAAVILSRKPYEPCDIYASAAEAHDTIREARG